MRRVRARTVHAASVLAHAFSIARAIAIPPGSRHTEVARSRGRSGGLHLCPVDPVSQTAPYIRLGCRVASWRAVWRLAGVLPPGLERHRVAGTAPPGDPGSL